VSTCRQLCGRGGPLRCDVPGSCSTRRRRGYRGRGTRGGAEYLLAERSKVTKEGLAEVTGGDGGAGRQAKVQEGKVAGSPLQQEAFFCFLLAKVRGPNNTWRGPKRGFASRRAGEVRKWWGGRRRWVVRFVLLIVGTRCWRRRELAHSSSNARVPHQAPGKKKKKRKNKKTKKKKTRKQNSPPSFQGRWFEGGGFRRGVSELRCKDPLRAVRVGLFKLRESEGKG